jgi:hypothetical protein
MQSNTLIENPSVLRMPIPFIVLIDHKHVRFSQVHLNHDGIWPKSGFGCVCGVGKVGFSFVSGIGDKCAFRINEVFWDGFFAIMCDAVNDADITNDVCIYNGIQRFCPKA